MAKGITKMMERCTVEQEGRTKMRKDGEAEGRTKRMKYVKAEGMTKMRKT